MSMPLNQLLPQATSNILVRELTLDSRHVRPGDLFLAVPGLHVDGRDYIADAIARGAAAVAYESKGAPAIEDSAALLIPVHNLQAQLSAIAGRFYGEPSRALTLIGVTGTNGKTTVTQLIAQALDALGEKCAVIGTLGNGFLDAPRFSGFTTPDALQLQATLSDFRRSGADMVAMEVSSHGLQQQRVAALDMDYAVLTNLTRDHLDYHGDMQSYAQAKAQLFAWPGLKVRVLNIDDAFGESLAQTYAGKGVKSYSIERREADVHCRHVSYSAKGIEARVETAQGEALLRSCLLGRFNLSNLLAVVAVLEEMGYALGDILDVMPCLKAPAGRMQAVHADGQPLVVIDYAHTPDALAQVLETVRLHVAGSGRVYVVFGCGGERDKGKRPLMAQAAAGADVVIVTDDNPRHEDAASIRQEILAGIVDSTEVHEIADRAEAIRFAIEQAQAGDLVLVAGKGHEAYQESQGERIAYSDLGVVQAAMHDKQEVAHV